MRPLLITNLAFVVALVHGQVERPASRTRICAPLTLAECKRQAQVCLDLTKKLRDLGISYYASYVKVSACAYANDIGFFQLMWARRSYKTNAEILRDAGADDETAREITRCVLEKGGFADSNNVLNVTAVKDSIRPIIDRYVPVQRQKQATLDAVDTCVQPTIDTMREYTLCITEACIKGR